MPPAIERDRLSISYLSLRKSIGVLGLALPIVLPLGAWLLFDAQSLEDSISDYYHTGMRNIFVGILCAIGVFLFSYKGFERKDDIAGDLACIFAVGVAIFPTTPDGDVSSVDKLLGILHFASAGLFLATLAYFSYFLFTKSNVDVPPPGPKRNRNRIYRASGYVIVASIVLIAVVKLLPSQIEAVLLPYRPVFWLEAAAVIAFGMSWIVKGEMLMRDVVAELEPADTEQR